MLRRINDVLQFLRRVGVLEGFVKYRITQALAGYALGDPGHAGGPLTPSEEASHLGKLADWDEADGQHGAARDAVVVAVSEVVDAEELIDDVIEPVGRGLAHEPGAGDRVAVIQATQEGVEQEHVWPVFDQLERPAVQDLGGLVLGERLVRARAPAAGRTFAEPLQPGVRVTGAVLGSSSPVRQFRRSSSQPAIRSPVGSLAVTGVLLA